MTLRFTVTGTPAPQGSKKGYVVNGRAVVVEDSKKTKPWRQDVQAAAISAVGDRPPLEGPLEVTLLFRMPRPGYHFGTGRNAGVLKPTAPTYVDKKPDLDKLIRALLDGMTRIVYRDDAQIAAITAVQVYASHPYRSGVDVIITPLPNESIPAAGDDTEQQVLL